MDSNGLLVHDVVEKDVIGVPAPFGHELDPPETGFPQPRRRPKVSAFRARRMAGQNQGDNDAMARKGTTEAPRAAEAESDEAGFYARERRTIDEENKRTIESMSAEEIEEARRELMQGLTPSIVERLMQRASIDDEPSSNSPFAPSPATGIKPPPDIKVEDTTAAAKPEAPSGRSAQPPRKQDAPLTKQPLSKGPKPHPTDEDRAPSRPPADLFPITSPEAGPGSEEGLPPLSSHFPQPVGADAEGDGKLDPADPDFLEALHARYFPDLAPPDPARLAWMAPLPTEGSDADRASPYHPDQASLPVAVLRFDFAGRLVPPRRSRAVPVSEGLHHHGVAPEAAGYTVEELALLARSAVPAQRCIAFQTLGRMLFRLGQGEWGSSGVQDPLAGGIWAAVRKGRVVDTLAEEASKEAGHVSSRAFAVEALWLLEQGGWTEKLPAT